MISCHGKLTRDIGCFVQPSIMLLVCLAVLNGCSLVNNGTCSIHKQLLEADSLVVEYMDFEKQALGQMSTNEPADIERIVDALEPLNETVYSPELGLIEFFFFKNRVLIGSVALYGGTLRIDCSPSDAGGTYECDDSMSDHLWGTVFALRKKHAVTWLDKTKRYEYFSRWAK